MDDVVPWNVVIEQVAAPTEEVRSLIGELEAELSANYPPHQRHGLRLDAIFQPHIAFFVARRAGEPVGCGGVALLDGFAELKRMYVREAARGTGTAEALLRRLEDTGRASGRTLLRLETGDAQHAAIRFYRRSGFADCAVFGDYARMDPEAIRTSVFMEKRL